ncbi:MAG: hypothetical protein LT102_03935 [Burkholderiaceae bacterium]|nr:hypothetical protein [Burkholderiaceae bacterium]
MNARDREAVLLARCVFVARQTTQPQAPHDAREANVFRLAAMVVESGFPRESRSLMQASERYFTLHPDERLGPAEVVQRGWVSTLPRLRDSLTRRFREPRN